MRSLRLLYLLIVLLMAGCKGCPHRANDDDSASGDDDDIGGSDDDDAAGDDDDDDATLGDDDDAAGDDDDDDDATLGDDDDAAGDDDDDSAGDDDDDDSAGDDDDDDDSAGDDDDDDSAGDDDDDSAGDDDDDSAGDDDDDDDDATLGDDDDSASCGDPGVNMVVTVELLDPYGVPTTQLSTSEPLTVQVTLENTGTTPENQYYGSNCLYQHFFWDGPNQYTISPPRNCQPMFQTLTFACGLPPVVDSDNVLAWETDLSGNPTTTPIAPGLYDLDIDTYSYGVYSFIVEVVP